MLFLGDVPLLQGVFQGRSLPSPGRLRNCATSLFLIDPRLVQGLVDSSENCAAFHVRTVIDFQLRD